MPLVGTISITAFSYDTVASINSSLASVIGFLVAAFLSILSYIAIPITASVLIYRKIRLLTH